MLEKKWLLNLQQNGHMNLFKTWFYGIGW